MVYRVLAVAVLGAFLAGCSVQMGNMKAGLLDGWNQPTTRTTEKTTENPLVR